MSANLNYDPRLALYLVEPSAVITEALATLLEEQVRSLECFPNAELLLRRRLVLAPRRVLITELHLPGMSGIELMLALKRKDLSTPTIIITIDTNIRTAVQAIRHGAVDVVEKPCIAVDVLDSLRRVEAEQSWSCNASTST